MALYLDVEPDDVVRIGDVTVKVEAKSGKRTRLKISDAPDVRHEKAGFKPKENRDLPVLTRPRR